MFVAKLTEKKTLSFKVGTYLLCGYTVLTESVIFFSQLGFILIDRTMPSADSCFQKSSLVSRDLSFYLKKAPSIRPLSLISYEVNGSGALLARFGKKIHIQINS